MMSQPMEHMLALSRIDRHLAFLLIVACRTPVRNQEPAPEPPVGGPRVGGASADLAAIAAWTQPRVPTGATVAGLPNLSAQTCAGCHDAIHAEWAASTHNRAWVDPQFQAELHKDPSVAWLCINCHTPMADQQPRLVAAPSVLRDPPSRPNPAFDPALQAEGITCVACHWRAAGIAGVHEDAVAPHALVFDGTLRDPALCTSCHQAMAQVEPTLVCHFDTGAEWKAANPGRTCQQCHMEAVERPVAVGGPARTVGRHLWPGSLLAKTPLTDLEQSYFATWEPGVGLSLDAPAIATAGAASTVTAWISHERAGHRVPTGDPERHLIVRVTATDSTGTVLATAEERIGQTWEWWPVAILKADNRLSPGERRAVALPFVVPPDGEVRIDAVVEHVRISDENAEFHALGDYPRRREVARARWP
jgi:hypothetical protein